jgi:2-C-methyl-D-erythritol 4-phosphate cytidylyltransferase
MTTALIFAGGAGQRMNTRSKPKQFLELHGKPIIIYTLEHFEDHPEIDDIVVVCIDSWINELKHLLRHYAFEKVSRVVPGGDGGDADLISANIAKVKERGVAITIEPVTESVVRLGGDDLIEEVPPRAEMYTAKAPQSFRYGLIWDLYQRAQSEGLRSIDSAYLCNIYGIEMHTVKSTPNNISALCMRQWKMSRYSEYDLEAPYDDQYAFTFRCAGS